LQSLPVTLYNILWRVIWREDWLSDTRYKDRGWLLEIEKYVYI